MALTLREVTQHLGKFVRENTSNEITEEVCGTVTWIDAGLVAVDWLQFLLELPSDLGVQIDDEDALEFAGRVGGFGVGDGNLGSLTLDEISQWLVGLGS